MQAVANDIIKELQKSILTLQGFKHIAGGSPLQFGLEALEQAFPNSTFPVGAIHEFLNDKAEDAAATNGFIAGLLSTLMRTGGACVWIGSARKVFPPALKAFGVEPDRVVFIDLKQEKDVLWVMEEALKCNGLAAVVGEIKDINLTASRRLQLAVEQSRVTGFLIRNNPRNTNTIASVARWYIKSVSSLMEDDMPGVGFPRWNVQLDKVRNGKPGQWQIEWSHNQFRILSPTFIHLSREEKRKTG